MERQETLVLPHSLLSQLQSDEETTQEALAFSTPAEATPVVRAQAERILLRQFRHMAFDIL